MKVYVVGPQKNYARIVEDFELVSTISEAETVIFTGGHDVTPEMYNETKHHLTGNSPERDYYELQEYKKAKELNKFCVGICRGGQFLTVMSGGKLVQHVTNHALPNGHLVRCDDQLFMATSSHHQMFYPFDVNHEMIGVSAEKRSNVYFKNAKEKYEELPVEPEIVYYPDTHCLAIQPHPEWQVGTPFWKYCSNLIKEKYHEWNEKSLEAV